ncbi:MAG: (d)CMP kinase [Firmicutes bacterium]|nr:(d)CMP kinase [Bacillota bacterium]
MPHEIYHIAIDGPSASGKGTIARELSMRLDIPALDTGALYRAVAVYLMENQIDHINEVIVNHAMNDIDMDVEIKNNQTHVFINGDEKTHKIRKHDISMIATEISYHKCVKDKLTKIMQQIAHKQSIILDGRDIASVVLPNAKYKFYLTASVETRAQRRLNDIKNPDLTLENIIEHIKKRDYIDFNRPFGALVRVPDAILVDSTNHKSIDETVDIILQYIY